MSESEDKPVVNGLVALVAVAVVVGILAGVGALAGTKVLGFGGSSGGSGATAAEDSLYLPDPQKTSKNPNPLVTLQSDDDDAADSSKSPKSKDKGEKEKKPKREITLSAASSTASPGQDFYLSGTYPKGEGAVLDVEIRVNGEDWSEFPVDVNVSNESFTTYVNTSKTGSVQWRLVDRERKVTSNAVKVKYS